MGKLHSAAPFMKDRLGNPAPPVTANGVDIFMLIFVSSPARPRLMPPLMPGSSPSLDIGFRNITRLNQCVDASPGELGAIFSKAVVQKRAPDPIFAAEIMIIPSTVLRHSLRYVGCGLCGEGETKDREAAD
jgi:hypothetical protein